MPPTITAIETLTTTQSQTQTDTQSTTSTATGTLTTVVTDPTPKTYTLSITATATDTANVYYFSWTRTGTATATANRTATATTTSISIGSKTVTTTATVTSPYNGTETKTFTGVATVTGTFSRTPTATLTLTASSTLTTNGIGTYTYAASGTQSLTATGSATFSGTQTWTYHPTGTVTNTGTKVVTNTLTSTQTQTQTTTVTNACVGSWAFCDNFESGNTSSWTVRQGTASDFSVITDGTKVLRQQDSTPTVWHVMQAGAKRLDQTVEAKMKALSFSNSNAAMVLFGRYQVSSAGDCGYYMGMRGDGLVTIAKLVNGVRTLIGTPYAGGIVAGVWNTAKLEVAGTTLKAYLNGNLVLTQTDSTCQGGTAGVGSVGASFEADDVRVTTSATNACIQSWAGSACDTCSSQTQPDLKQCSVFLDCYKNNNCSPDTCGGADDVCGVNTIVHMGSGPKWIADQVFACLGCPGQVRCDIPAQGDGYSCEDGNPCTQGDTCQGKVCQPGPMCPPADQCHGAGTCTNSACSNPALADNTPCDDGNPLTQDVCTMGLCQGTQTCSPVNSIASGATHTCAVRWDKSLWCWGGNDSGQLGTGGSDPSLVPVRAGLSTSVWLSVTAGENFTCARRHDQTLWCWGGNAWGQLGNGTQTPSGTPTQLGGPGWSSVSAGQLHACGVHANGALSCWGDNTYGAIGDGTYNPALSPVEVPQAGWTEVAAGAHHTCALKGNHTLWCWGQNAYGQLGNGSTDNNPVPQQIAGDTWNSISAGGSHTCATKLDATLWCWGANDSGQLGIGPTTMKTTPTAVSGSRWATVSAGGAYTCATQSDSTLWCWGANAERELGDGTTTDRSLPVRVPGQAWSEAAAAVRHTCGRRQDGSLWCWGSNQHGEFGDGSSGSPRDPAQVVGNLCSQVPICGNGTTEAGEECDDGNNANGDQCTSDCKTDHCYGQPPCEGADQCHGVCDPATGECHTDETRPDNTPCEDNDACSGASFCASGACQGRNWTSCADPGSCQKPGVCQPATGECKYEPIVGIGCGIDLKVDGVVDLNGDQTTYVAVFGYESTATTSYRPDPTQNVVTGATDSASSTPPAYLVPGSHHGSFLPTFTWGQTITWTVDGVSVKATAEAQAIPTTTNDNGDVVIDVGGGATVTVKPNMDQYSKAPDEPSVAPQPASGTLFKGMLTGSLAVGPNGAAIYTVPLPIPPGIAGMAPNLNLVYNSQAGPGIAGQGWDMTGLSAIQRCRKTTVADGQPRTIMMDTTAVDANNGDGVCLDGKRLFVAESLSKTTRFDSEFTDFSSISYWRADDYFVVTTKAGESRYYGYRGESRVRFSAEDDSGNSLADDITAVWPLDKVQDAWGNYYGWRSCAPQEIGQKCTRSLKMRGPTRHVWVVKAHSPSEEAPRCRSKHVPRRKRSPLHSHGAPLMT